MTPVDPRPGGPTEPDRLAAAEADLARVRAVLSAVAAGQADLGEVRDVLRGYLDEHGDTLRAAAAYVGAEVQRQALAALHSWRAQLDDQLRRGRT